MGKVKLYDIAKELNLTSKEVLEMAKKLNIEAKSHLSSIEDDEANRLREKIKESKKETKKETKKTNNEKQEKKSERGGAPVIIRREVIIADDKNAPKANEKKEEKINNKLGFVERKNNKDYNIVYRNKTAKPMTVDELFGIKKETPKQPEKVEPKTENIKEKVEIKENKMDVEISKKDAEKPSSVKQEDKQEVRKEFNQERKAENKNAHNANNRNVNNYNNRNTNNNRDFRQNNNNNNNNRFNKDRNNNNPKFGNRNNQNPANGNKFDNKNRQGGNPRFGGNRPLDERGIEKNIKDIMAVETIEKEPAREYNKSIDKQKQNNKFDDTRATKKNTKSRKNSQNGEINEHKLKGLKRTNQLSNMFDDQEGGMLDYYDLTTQRGKKGKKKLLKEEERNKQKIFKLEEITISETITVKDFAAELKKTSAEIIKKLLGYGVMATLNNEIDFDTASLIADEFGIKVNKKETVTEEDILFDDSEDREEELETRPPVVVVMGHVDHGKTSLLDAVKNSIMNALYIVQLEEIS